MNSEEGFIPKRYSEAFERLDAEHAAREEFWGAFIARTDTFTGPVTLPTYTGEADRG